MCRTLPYNTLRVPRTDVQHFPCAGDSGRHTECACYMVSLPNTAEWRGDFRSGGSAGSETRAEQEVLCRTGAAI